ncbi:type VI secretion system TssO [Staphylococcus rostri]|uniref:Uncharacterized protein n=1 Tax=Staphylococcus rostri TaxID=522262 RepID=A0A2K3YS19_9STAP|nr:type VI secretion system TssO [Staphylococcus rostri]PNZ28403.1 hypothetical protein CD122_04595 [Staphylococcus rostri]
MRRTQHSDVYPRVEKILDDGTIIAYDKYNQLNTDLNINTLTDQQQHDVFGGILIKNTRQPQTHDYEYLRQKDAELQRTNRKNKWLLVGFVIALLVIGLFVFKSCSQNDTDNTMTQDEQTLNEQETALQQKDAELQQQIKDTQDSIASNDTESQSKIDQLKQQIQDLRDSIDNKQADKVANQYEDTIDNLQDAEDERQSGNLDKMQEQLDKVNSKLDEITQKINDWLNN